MEGKDDEDVVEEGNEALGCFLLLLLRLCHQEIFLLLVLIYTKCERQLRELGIELKKPRSYEARFFYPVDGSYHEYVPIVRGNDEKRRRKWYKTLQISWL